MPRTTPAQQFDRYQTVREGMITRADVMIVLPPMAQLDLHKFYDPEHNHSLDSLVTYQAKATAEDASLPQRAGKAYSRLVRTFEMMQGAKESPPPKRWKTARVAIL